MTAIDSRPRHSIATRWAAHWRTIRQTPIGRSYWLASGECCAGCSGTSRQVPVMFGATIGVIAVRAQPAKARVNGILWSRLVGMDLNGQIRHVFVTKL